jgi:hypothetical protein
MKKVEEEVEEQTQAFLHKGGEVLHTVVDSAVDLGEVGVQTVEDIVEEVAVEGVELAGNIAKPFIVPAIEIGIVALLVLVIVEKVL